MQFKTEKGEFLKIIQTVQNAISAKSTLPILSNILIEINKNSLKMTATDLDIGISSKTPIAHEVEGSITLPAKKLMDVIKELPDNAKINVTTKKNNTTTIECGKIIFRITGLPKDEFPTPPDFQNKDKITIDKKTLKDMISLTLFAVSRDETRYVLNGVLTIIKQKTIKLVATDGRRLAVIEKELPKQTLIEKKIIIPTKTIQELERLLTEEGVVTISFDENQVMFNLGETTIISRLIEGEFPNYEQVVPQESKDKVVIDRNTLLAATKRASIFTNQDSLVVRMDISKNKMVISKNTPFMGEVKEEVEVAYKGKNISIGFNPHYIIEVLKNLDPGEIKFEITDSEKPGVIRLGNEYTYVVLPMQIA